jgi:FkbM family methyltransferase
MDMFDETTGKVAASPRLKVVSLNPKPIVMLESKFTISQFAYVRTYHGEANVRKVMRLVYEAEGTGCDAPLADDDFSYATLPDKWDLKRAKSGGRNEGALVLDIGANEGFYSMMASAYGCRVVSFEPQPMCVALISAAIAFNNFRHPVKLINRVVQNQKVEFWAPNEQCSGVVQYIKTKDDEKNSNDQLVKSATIDDIVEANGGSRVILAHMDVEGAEIRVLESGLKSIQAKKIDNFVVEVNFGRWQNYGVTVEHARSVLEQVRTGGDFVCRSLDVGGGGDPRTYPIIESWNTYDFPKEIDAWCTSDPKFKQVITESQANQKSYHTGNAPSTFNYNEQ